MFFARFALYIQEKEESELRPVFTDEGVTFVYIKVGRDIDLEWLQISNFEIDTVQQSVATSSNKTQQ